MCYPSAGHSEIGQIGVGTGLSLGAIDLVGTAMYSDGTQWRPSRSNRIDTVANDLYRRVVAEGYSVPVRVARSHRLCAV